MNPDWLRPEWRLDHPSYWVPCADPSVFWSHPQPVGFAPDGTLSPFTRHEFRKNGYFHRLDGPALLSPNEYYEFRVNGRLHRLDGPARNIHNSVLEFYMNGRLHRVDGPAYLTVAGHLQWWVNGIRFPDNPSDLDILGALL